MAEDLARESLSNTSYSSGQSQGEVAFDRDSDDSDQVPPSTRFIELQVETDDGEGGEEGVSGGGVGSEEGGGGDGGREGGGGDGGREGGEGREGVDNRSWQGRAMEGEEEEEEEEDLEDLELLTELR